MQVNQPIHNKQINQILRRLSQPVKKRIYTAWLLSIIYMLMFIVQSWYLSILFFHFLEVYFYQYTINHYLTYQSLFIVIICLILRPLVNFFKNKLAFQAGIDSTNYLRQIIIKQLEKIAIDRYRYGNDGSLSSQVLEQIDSLIAYISRFYLQRFIVITTPILIFIAALSQSFFAGLILLITAPLVPIFMILIGHATARKSAEQFTALAQLNGRFLDWLRGMNTLKYLNATAIASRDIYHSADDYRIKTMSVLKIAFLNSAVLELLSALSIALLAVYLGFGLMGILPWQKDIVPVPYQTALFLLLLAPEFYAPLRQLGADYHVKAQAEGAIQNLLPILNLNDLNNIQEAIKNKSIKIDDDKYLPNKKSKLLLDSAPSLLFQQVSVVSNQRQRLNHFSLSIKPGQRIAIIGKSGCGKSTLLQTLLGFCEYQGNIMIENVDFLHLDHDEMRKQIAYLSQQTVLLPISIADNLRLVKSHATDEELWTVLKQVKLDHLIRKLPQQLNTQLGERGSGLSGGQQRRLAIAQLILQNAPLWLLDEPTEHLDIDTAQQINQLLNQITTSKTVLWVTHDPQICEWLDTIMDLSLNGSIDNQYNDVNINLHQYMDNKG